MNSAEVLNQCFEDIQSGKSSAEIFYGNYWERAVSLTLKEFEQLRSCSELLSNQSIQNKAWHQLFLGLHYTFHAGKGDVYETITAAIDSFEKAEDHGGKGAAKTMLSIYLKNSGQLDKAQLELQQVFELIQPKSNYGYFLTVAMYQAGEIQHMLKDYQSAIDIFEKLLSMDQSNNSMQIRALNALGVIQAEKGNFEDADMYFDQVLTILEGTSNLLLKSKIFVDRANSFFLRGNFERCIAWHQKSIELRLKLDLKSPLITNYSELADVFLRQKMYSEALEYALKAESLAIDLNQVIKQYPIYRILSSIYESKGDAIHALEYYKKFHVLKDEVLSQENTRRINQMSMNYQIENAQKEKEIFALKNVVLKEALDEIEASVRYAKRIQQTILPQPAVVSKYLPDSFVLFIPKDIVAGDFYWVENHDNLIVAAVADCTGHGVPGAMVSVICNNNLNRNLYENKITEPGLLLDQTRENIIREFDKSEENVQDGMDISLLTIQPAENNTNQKTFVKWAGAHNPLYIARNGEIIQIDPDKQPVGKFHNAKPFTTHEVPVEKGDVLYLVTDGYQDQFGGEHGKKFKISRLKKVFQEISLLSMNEQHDTLLQTFYDWKGKLDQIDDVTIMGIRIH